MDGWMRFEWWCVPMLEVGGLLPQLTSTHAKLIIRQKEHALSCCRDVNTAQRWNRVHVSVLRQRWVMQSFLSCFTGYNQAIAQPIFDFVTFNITKKKMLPKLKKRLINRAQKRQDKVWCEWDAVMMGGMINTGLPQVSSAVRSSV